MSERYFAKREAGLPATRRDGSSTSPETDRQAAAAERFAAGQLGAEFNAEVYATHGDRGHDFTVLGKKGRRRYTVEVVWLGPRDSGHLIVNPHEPWRWADVYVLVSGSIEMSFSMSGWISHADLVALPQKNFGYGDRFAARVDELTPFDPRELHKPEYAKGSFYDSFPEPEIEF